MGNFYFPQPLVPNMHKFIQFCLYCIPYVILHEIKKKKYDLPVHQKSQVSPGTLTVANVCNKLVRDKRVLGPCILKFCTLLHKVPNNRLSDCPRLVTRIQIIHQYIPV